MATQTAKKTTATCNVSFSRTHIEVQSESGNVCRLNLGETPDQTWLAMNASDREFLLWFVNPDLPAEQELSFADMRRFKLLAESIKSVSKVAPKLNSVKDSSVKLLNKVQQRTLVQTDNLEAKIGGLKTVCDKLAKEFLIVHYDISEDKKEECPNPSFLFRWYGFRMTESCWIMPLSSVESEKIQEVLQAWKEVGIRHGVTPIAEKALEQIRQMAREQLDETIRAKDGSSRVDPRNQHLDYSGQD